MPNVKVNRLIVYDIQDDYSAEINNEIRLSCVGLNGVMTTTIFAVFELPRTA